MSINMNPRLKLILKQCSFKRWCQTHFGIKGTLTTTIVKTNQDALSQDILTRDFNLTCLKGKYLKMEPFCQTFPLSA